MTCAAVGGAACPASGSGDLAETVDLPAGSSVTFTVTGTVDPDAFFGVIANTAAADPPVGVGERNAADNQATDETTIDTPVLFADGFENGDTAAWDNTVGL